MSRLREGSQFLSPLQSLSQREGGNLMFDDFPDILTVDESCEVLRIGHNALYALVNSGKLNAYKNGRVWRIPKTSNYFVYNGKLKNKPGICVIPGSPSLITYFSYTIKYCLFSHFLGSEYKIICTTKIRQNSIPKHPQSVPIESVFPFWDTLQRP